MTTVRHLRAVPDRAMSQDPEEQLPYHEPGAPVPRDARAIDQPRDGYMDWDALYLDNVVWVYRLLFGKVGNRPDAEDLTADVFLTVLRPLRLDASRGEVRGYLVTTARTVLAGYWRRRLGIQVTEIDVTSLADFERAPADSSDAPIRAERALAGLSDRHRQILELRFLHGSSIKEAATAMAVSVANAKVLQHRALRLAAKAGQGWSE